MANEFYTPSGYPSTNSFGASGGMRAELAAVMAGFDKMPILSTNALKLLRINAAGNAFEAFADPAPGTYLTIAAAAAGYLPLHATADAAAVLATPRTIGGTSFNGSANIAIALAATATALATARAINGVNFDGSAAITINAVDATARLALTGGTMSGAVTGITNLSASTLHVSDASGVSNFTVGGTLAAPATTGSATNAYARFVDASGSRALDIGTSSSGAWIQSRDKNDYSVNYDLLLQSNGGNTYIGAGTLSIFSANGQAGLMGASGVTDNFTVDTNKVIHNYGLSWKTFSDAAAGPSVALSGYGGLRLYTAGTERLRIDLLGRVGIGAASAGETLGLTSAGDTYLLIKSTGTNPVQAYYQAGSSSSTANIGTLNNFPFSFWVNSVERMRINTNGDLLIGNTAASPYSSPSRGLVELSGSANALFCLKIGSTQAGYMYHDGTNMSLNSVVGGLQLFTNNIARMTISSAGVIADANGFEFGYKDVVQFLTTGAYTAVVGDRGKSIVINAAGTITLPSGVFSGGAVITYYNNLGSAVTLVQGAGLTLRFGAQATPLTGSRTLANNGMCTIYYINGSVAVITGSGLT